MTDDFIHSTTFKIELPLTLFKPPKPVGLWVMPGASSSYRITFAAYKKPNALVRFSMKHVFGLAWDDRND
jgi:hypothetical protein